MTGKAEAQVSFNIPEELIRGHLTAAVIQSIGNPDKMINAIVQAALHAKPSNSYGSGKSLFEEEVGKVIREEAINAFKGWLDDMRPVIRDRVVARLNTARLDELADHAAEKLIVRLVGEATASSYVLVE